MSVHNRWLHVVLVLSLILPGLALGTRLGGRFLVPAGSGLTGAPIALGYGLLAAVVLAGMAWCGPPQAPDSPSSVGLKRPHPARSIESNTLSRYWRAPTSAAACGFASTSCGPALAMDRN